MHNSNNVVQPSYRGKVRDIYDLGDTMILLATDRVSAFDVILNNIIPGKGEILTQISNHWLSLINILPNHIIETNHKKFPKPFCDIQSYSNRSVWVKKAKRIDIECIVRGYLLGSAYKDYKNTGKIFGLSSKTNLKYADKFTQPIFTPTTKNDTGKDKIISFSKMENLIGRNLSQQLRDYSLQIYQFGYDKLYEHGIVLLDTKIEYGIHESQIILIDEIFTPDSSRFCYIHDYQSSIKNQTNLPSLDKQIIRDYLEMENNSIKLDSKVELPPNIIYKTQAVYKELQEMILKIY